ncbi:MAG: tyrosine-type recombinase/integrase [Anaerolineales bacterium]|nr:tyrosine-type recombinase/integrase [Anaerolineales bacterium]
MTTRPAPTAHITPHTQLIPAINAWRIFLNDQGNSIHTIKAFTADLSLLAAYLPPDRTLGSITTIDLNNFLQWMQKGRGIPCSPKTLARRTTSLKAFFRWLHEHGVLLVNPAEAVIQKSVISPLPTVLTPDEAAAILEAAAKRRNAKNPDTRYYSLAALLLSTGIKKSEALNLTLNHIDLDSPHGPILFVRYPNPQHRYKERKIPLPNDWVEAYREYKSQYNLSDRLFPWSPRRLEYLLEDLSEQAGLDKHLSFEMCRWTCALNDLRAGIEAEKIRQKLGISKIQWREVSQKLKQLAAKVDDEPIST